MPGAALHSEITSTHHFSQEGGHNIYSHHSKGLRLTCCNAELSLTGPSLGLYPRQGQAASWVRYLLPCYTTQHREPPSKGCASPLLSPGDPSAVQRRQSSPARKEMETRGLVQDCPALPCILLAMLQNRNTVLSECPLLGPKRTGMFFETLHQHMPRAAHATPSSSAPWQHHLSTLRSLQSLQLPFLFFPPLGLPCAYIYIWGARGWAWS